MRHGVTLVELLLGLVILGLMGGVALPRLAFLRDRLLVEQEAGALATAISRARAEALLYHRRVELTALPDSLHLRALGATDTVDIWRRPGPATVGVRLVAPGVSLVFLPSGLPFGLANGRWQFDRGGAFRRVILSRYGRVRIVP